MEEQKSELNIDGRDYAKDVCELAAAEAQAVGNFVHDYLKHQVKLDDLEDGIGEPSQEAIEGILETAFALGHALQERNRKYYRDRLDHRQAILDARVKDSKIIIPTLGMIKDHVPPAEFNRLRGQ